MAADTTTRRSPEDAPNRWHVAFGALIGLWAIWSLVIADTVAWRVVVLGFVSFAVATGPFAASAIGTRVGAWFRGIGVVGRGLLIVAFAVGSWTAIYGLEISVVYPTSFGLGGLLGVAIVVGIEAIRSRRYSSH